MPTRPADVTAGAETTGGDTAGGDTACREVVGSGCGGFVSAGTRCEEDSTGTSTDSDDGYVRGRGECGCATVPAAGWGGALLTWLVLGALLSRRARRPIVFLFPLLLVFSTAPAHAQDAVGVEAQTVRTLDGGPFLLLTEADLGKPWELRAGLAVDHARGLVVLVDREGAHDLLQQVTTEEFGASVRFGELVRVGLAMPSHTRVYFDDRHYDAVPGDLSVWAAIALREGGRGPGLAWCVRIDVPTGTPELYLGAPEGAIVGTLAADTRLGGWSGLVNLGVQLALPTAIPGLDWGNRLEWGLGLNHGLIGPTQVGIEARGSVGLPPAGVAGDAPVEAMVDVGGVLWRGLGLTAGGGAGLDNGLGSPSLRVLVQLDARRRGAQDADGDGITDRRDACVHIPEDKDDVQDLDGCPEEDADGDGLRDPVDLCPLDPESRNGWQDDDGCPDAVSTVTVSVVSDDPAVPLERAALLIDDTDEVNGLGGEGVELVRAPGAMKVRASAPGFVTVEKTYELPPGGVMPEVIRLVPVRYGDVTVRLVDAGDRPLKGWARTDCGGAFGAPSLVDTVGIAIHLPAGPCTLRASAAGYRTRDVPVEVRRDVVGDLEVTLEPSGLRIDGAGIETRQEIRFTLDSAGLTPESLPPLEEIAALLRSDPGLRLLRVEGHADESGTSRYNLELSVRRADAVRDWLVGAGVDPARLEAIGSGESAAKEGGTVRAVTFTALVWDGA